MDCPKPTKQGSIYGTWDLDKITVIDNINGSEFSYKVSGDEIITFSFNEDGTLSLVMIVDGEQETYPGSYTALGGQLEIYTDVGFFADTINVEYEIKGNVMTWSGLDEIFAVVKSLAKTQGAAASDYTYIWEFRRR
jgi:hypothetical protein